MKDKIAKLIDVKSIVTISMTAALIALLFYKGAIDGDIKNLFHTSYIAVITYFFTRKNKTNEEEKE